jgi:hypothetical protein
MIQDYVDWIESHVSGVEDAWDRHHIFSLSIDLSFEDEVKMAGYERVEDGQNTLDGYQVNGDEIVFSLPSPSVMLIRDKLSSSWQEEAIVVLGLSS